MYVYIKRLNIRYRGITTGWREKKMRRSNGRADLLIFSLMHAYNPQKAFSLKKKPLSLFSYCIFFADKFLNMILLYSWKSSYKRTPETLNKCTSPFSPLRKAIPQEQEIWNYNSAGDEWYVALLWIINESRRALVLPSCPSMIQTVWHEQDTVAKQVETCTHTYTQINSICESHRFQHFRISGFITVIDVFCVSKGQYQPWNSNDYYSCALFWWNGLNTI